MAHTAAVAAQPAPTQYPLEPSYAPSTPVASSPDPYGYAAPVTSTPDWAGMSTSTYPLTPSYAPPQAAPVDPYGSQAPYVTPDTAPADYGGTPSWPTQPTQQDFVGIDRAMDTTSQFQPDWGVMTTPAEQGGGGFFGGLQSAAGNVWGGVEQGAQAAWGGLEQGVEAALPGTNESRREGGRSQLPILVNSLTSSEAFQDNVGIDTGYMDWLRSKGVVGKAASALIDQGLAPATLMTAAAGPAVPVLGSTFGGGLGARLAGEAGVSAVGMLAGEKSAEKAAEYTDNPWLIGATAIGTGVLGAGGVLGAAKAAKRAPGALKAADRALTGLDARIMEPGGSRLVTAGSSAEVPGLGTVTARSFTGEARAYELPTGETLKQIPSGPDRGKWKLTSTDEKTTVIASTPEAAVALVRDANNPLRVMESRWNADKNVWDVKTAEGTAGTQTTAQRKAGAATWNADASTPAVRPTPDVPVNAATIRDVTPEGYGPGPQTNFDPAPRDMQFTTEINRLRSSINEGETILRGKMLPEKRAAIERSVAASKQKMADMGYEVRTRPIDAEVSSAKPPSNPRAYDTPVEDVSQAAATPAPPKPSVADAGGTPPPRIPGELRAGPTAEESVQATTLGRSAANPSSLTDQELLDSIKRADDMVARADTRAADLVRSQGPQAPDTVTANRTLTMIEDDAERLRDEATQRGGVAKLGEASGGGKPPVEPPAPPRPEPPEIPGLPPESAKRVFNIFADAAEREGRPTSGGIFDMLAPTERAGTGLVRRYEGAVGTAGLDLRTDLDAGNRLLREAKQPGAWDGTRFVAKRTPEMEQLYKALHGEGQPPASLQKVYDAIKPMVEKESAATIDFDKAFVPRDDYFYRGWKEVPVGKAQNAGTGKGQFGAKPGFMKPRSDQSFADILNSVYTKPDGSQVKLEPVSWNPFEMAAIRKTAGEQFRAQSDMLAGLKETGMAVSADVAPDGWRVPRVGPAFEGKPFAFTPSVKDTGPMSRLADEGAAAVGYTKRIAVPDKVANDIESIFGRQPSFGALDSVLSFGQKAKQSKLLLSLFQQMDFGARTLGALNAGVIDEIAESVGKAVKLQPGASASHLVAAGRKFLAIPKDLAELPLANVSGAAQRRLRAGILDAKPIYKERPGITLKGVSENGGKFGTDISLVTRDIMADIAKGPKPAYMTTGVVGRRIRQVNAASQRGLFDGWYVQAQSTALKKTILPRIMRQHADWTDAQIMAGAADEVNKMFSTLGEYQTAIKNPAVKKLARGLIFSTNETEALLRGAASTVVGPNKRLWTEFYLGTFLGLAAIAETVHYATTGEHLPVERLNPIDTENKYGPLPVGYRTNFLAPDIPIKGRNNVNLTLDTVMQMDTIFRLLDPKAFVASRENVLPRAITNQITGKDFYDRTLKGPKDRITQAAIDLAEPIGAGNLRAATGFGPDSESRIGTAGALLQTAGANVRAENNAALKDRLAVEWAKSTGATKLDGSPIKGWDDVELSQRPEVLDSNPNAKAELATRGDEAAALGQASGFAAQTTANITRQQEESDKRLGSRDISAGQWVDDYRGRVDESRIRKDEIYRASKTKPGGNPVLDGYFGALDTAKLPDGNIDWDAVDAYRASLSPQDSAYIDRNTGVSINTPVVKAYRDTTNNMDQTGYYDLRDQAWEKFKVTDPRLANLPDYWTWRDGELKEIIGRLESEGKDSRLVGQMAATELGKYKAVTAFSEYYRKEFRHQWVVDNAELAKTAIYFDLFDPDAAEEKFLGMRK